MIQLAIFDMDGTICNTIDDLADATNFSLEKLGFPTHRVEEYKNFVGDGIEKLVYRALPPDNNDEKQLACAKELMLSFYKVHFADKTCAYNGLPEVLEALKEKGIHIAVCTNKVQYMAEEIEKKLFKDLFEIVIGNSPDRPLKPSAYSVEEIMNKYNVTPSETVFIGDSDVDMKTAINAKTHSIGVSWGFRSEKELIQNGAEHIAYKPKDILKIIESL